MWWLVEPSIRAAIEAAIASGGVPTAAEEAAYVARVGGGAGDPSRVLTVAGDVAEIRVQGVLTTAPSLLAMLFGGGNTTYADITAAIASAEADPGVARVDYNISSPGGHFDGLFETLAAMQVAKKPSRAVVHEQASSGAYAIACQCGEIVAATPASRVGSIGVAAGFTVDPQRVELTSTLAPRKRPDVTTPEGRAMVVEELDAMHELFADAIAAGRGTTVERVNAEFGQGATVLAADAMRRGMIDSIAGAKLRVVKSAPSAAASGPDSENPRMDLSTLKAQHPEVYAAAVEVGVAQERDRCVAHLVSGQGAGMIAEAIQAVEAGTAMTGAMTAKYVMAAANRRDQGTRQADDEAAAAAAAGAAGAEADDPGEAVLAAVEARLGISAEGSRA